ncbi:hypothetical protein [Paenibacillus sonchi]|uniref:hypothetical protein n=1 Tax=Paenibacillus sonchi TaxID=373687 RepID=UPI001E4A8573|nr:hypothetical protein [Paenibacillus sonchi]MCE3202045.1 hypothetical protein [Paenibacillus sonchi]
MSDEIQLEKEISTLILKILLYIRTNKELPDDSIRELLHSLEEIRKFTKGRDKISKTLAYQLFYLYTTGVSQAVYNKDPDNTILTELYMGIVAVLSDVLYQ